MTDSWSDDLSIDLPWTVDTNGDGLPDDVRLSIVLPEQVTPRVATAAIELAARLGHETMAATLPIVVRDSELSRAPTGALLVGPDNRWSTTSPDTDAGGRGEDDQFVADGANIWVVGDELKVAASLCRLARHRSPVDAPSETASVVDDAISQPIAPSPGLDLASLFTIDGLLADTNGDFLPDQIRARLELLPGCDAAEMTEAANIAARLGLEAIGLRLPLPGPHVVAVGPAGASALPGVRIERVEAKGGETVAVTGEAAARWLARSAPGPSDRAHPVRRSRERIAAALCGDDAPPTAQRMVWEATWQQAWEVDEARQLILTEVVPKLHPGSSVDLDVRVSEPAAVRRRLRDEWTSLLADRGATPTVTVRGAYKPGLTWLTEEVAPVLADLPTLAAVEIRVAEFRRSPGDEWLNPRLVKELALIDEAAAARLHERMALGLPADRWLDPPIRWLMELYPADELLPLPRERVTFAFDPQQTETYRVLARAEAGELLWQGSFAVPFTERPYLDAYPDLGLVHPTTGWIRVEVDREIVLDRRIATDLERTWDRFQAEVLPRLASHIRQRGGGAPRVADQPYFAALEVEATVSEPDEPLPVRQERLSALEVLHEEIYFTTLEFLKELGRREGDGPLEAPGQVVPWIHAGDGLPPRVRWSLRDFADDGTSARLSPLTAETAASAVRVVGVEVGNDGAERRIEVRVDLASPDAQASAAGRLDALVHDGVAIAARVELHAPGAEPIAIELPASTSPAIVEISAESVAELRRDGVLGYEEHLAVLRGLARLPGVRLWEAGRSFQGRAAWVVEWSLPNGGERTSHAKQVAWKPTLLINARHHGNEPSSTTAGLQLIEWLATDPAWEERRRRLNVVVVPCENLDGAELAWEMQREHPQWMLHAGRFSALGLEMRNAYGNPAHPGHETRVLPAVWRHWLPDVVVDDHGFPSHEWVQLFTGYIPLWPAYWLPRGIAYAYLKHIDDDAYQEHKAVAERLRHLMVEETQRDEELVAWNNDWADRYVTYANRWLPEAFPFIENDGLLVYFSPTRIDPAGRWEDWGTDFSTRHPQVTAVAFVTEIADETAQGDYMDLCARAHEALDVACVRLLTEADQRFIRQRGDDADTASFWAGRRRPVVALAES